MRPSSRAARLLLARITWLLWIAPAFLAGGIARAETYSIDGSEALPQALADGLVQSFGFLFDHKPYDGGVGRGARTFAISGEATVLKGPDSLFTALSGMGMSLSSSSLPFVPALKAHLDIGITDRFDLNLSGLYLPSIGAIPGLLMVGGNFKYGVFVPEEGPWVSIRAGYNVMSFSMNQSGTAINSTSATWTTALMVARKVSVFEPYAGGGYQFTYGRLQTVTTFTNQPLAGDSIVVTSGKNAAVAGSFLAFVGLKLDVFLQLVLEGGYSQAGATYFGLKLGLGL